MEKGLNKDNYWIYNLMSKQQKLIQDLFLLLIVVLIFYLIMNITYYNRDIIAVEINNNSFSQIVVGFQKISYADSFFQKLPKGELRLYIEAEDQKINEIVFTLTKNNIGEGVIYIPLTLPKTNETWNVKFELKDNNYKTLELKCYTTNFLNDGTTRTVIQNENSC